MDPSEFVDAVREDNKTALSRLGASKALYADTGGDLEDDAVLGAVADRAHHAAAVFEGWADEESGGAADLFETAAATERDHVETVAGELDGYEPGDPPGVVVHLRGVEGTVARLGAFVGWALAAGNNADQVVGYFVGQASPRTASTFREVSADYDDYLDDAGDALAASASDDWETAREAAGAAVQADYDDYFETLDAMGVNPKPVC